MPPWLLLLAVFALALSFAYQMNRKRSQRFILLYWLVILVFAVAGEVLAESMGSNITRFGDLRLLPDIVFAGVGIGTLRLLRL